MRIYLFALLTLVFLACEKDEDPFIPGEDTLHHDGDNLSAPVIAQGISYSAVRFSGDDIMNQGHEGKNLAAIDFYMDQRPIFMRIIVFGWNDAEEDEPGDVLLEYDLNMDRLDEGAWNRHVVGGSMVLPQNGIWVAFEINAGDENLRVIGCDPGPRVPNGDVYGIFGDNNPGWTSFYEFSDQSVDINWNIRVEVE